MKLTIKDIVFIVFMFIGGCFCTYFANYSRVETPIEFINEKPMVQPVNTETTNIPSIYNDSRLEVVEIVYTNDSTSETVVTRDCKCTGCHWKCH